MQFTLVAARRYSVLYYVVVGAFVLFTIAFFITASMPAVPLQRFVVALHLNSKFFHTNNLPTCIYFLIFSLIVLVFFVVALRYLIVSRCSRSFRFRFGKARDRKASNV